MNIKLSTRSLAATAALVLAGLGMTGAAQARDDVYWSVGLSSPGVQLGFANAPPVMVVQQPVYSQPYPVYSQPYPVYNQPRPVYFVPRPVIYVQGPPVFVSQPQYIRTDWRYRDHGRKWKQGHHDRDRDHDRGRGRGRDHDRDDD